VRRIGRRTFFAFTLYRSPFPCILRIMRWEEEKRYGRGILTRMIAGV